MSVALNYVWSPSLDKWVPAEAAGGGGGGGGCPPAAQFQALVTAEGAVYSGDRFPGWNTFPAGPLLTASGPGYSQLLVAPRPNGVTVTVLVPNAWSARVQAFGAGVPSSTDVNTPAGAFFAAAVQFPSTGGSLQVINIGSDILGTGLGAGVVAMATDTP